AEDRPPPLFAGEGEQALAGAALTGIEPVVENLALRRGFFLGEGGGSEGGGRAGGGSERAKRGGGFQAHDSSFLSGGVKKKAPPPLWRKRRPGSIFCGKGPAQAFLRRRDAAPRPARPAPNSQTAAGTGISLVGGG